MNYFSDFKEKIALVMGGSQGIGFTLAKGLAQCGAKLIIVNRRASQGQAAAQEIADAGGSAISTPGDISQKISVEEIVNKTLEHYGRIDVLVNSAAVTVRKPATEVTEEDYDRILNINLKGLFLCCQVVGNQMIRQGRGKIINISSVAATFALINRSPYCTSKGGVTQLTRVLALEWAKYGVYVNAIAPGIIQTPLIESYMKSDPERIMKTIQKIPLGRFGKPKDLVGIALFLASKASDYVTGQTLYVDGGYSLGCMDW